MIDDLEINLYIKLIVHYSVKLALVDTGMQRIKQDRIGTQKPCCKEFKYVLSKSLTTSYL